MTHLSCPRCGEKRLAHLEASWRLMDNTRTRVFEAECPNHGTISESVTDTPFTTDAKLRFSAGAVTCPKCQRQASASILHEGSQIAGAHIRSIEADCETDGLFYGTELTPTA